MCVNSSVWSPVCYIVTYILCVVLYMLYCYYYYYYYVKWLIKVHKHSQGASVTPTERACATKKRKNTATEGETNKNSWLMKVYVLMILKIRRFAFWHIGYRTNKVRIFYTLVLIHHTSCMVSVKVWKASIYFSCHLKEGKHPLRRKIPGYIF